MNASRWTLTSAAWVLAASTALGQTRGTDDARIDALVRKLGSSAYVQREKARQELEAIGTPALGSLRRASKETDVETARRIADLIRNFEEHLLTKQVLAPKAVQLQLKGVTVQQAIDELAKVSGYPVQFLGDATKFADKKITLDTGKTSFWHAVEQLCDQAGLMERIDLTPLQVSPGYYSKGKAGIRRIYPATPQAVQSGPILLTNRGTEKSHVNIAGSLKTELRVARDAGAKELTLTLLVSAEPHLQNNGILGRAILDRIVDTKERRLTEFVDPPQSAPMAADGVATETPEDLTQTLQRFTQFRIRNDDRAAKAIKELAGKLAYQLDIQNELLAKVENILSAGGISAATTNGGTLRVLGVRKQDDEVVFVDVTLENTAPNPYANNIIFNGNGGVIIRGLNVRGGIVVGPGSVRINGGDGSNKDLPDLVDAKGQKFKVGTATAENFNFTNGGVTRTATIQFLPHPGQAEPRQLVLFGTRTHTITVPFRFENVPLP